MKNKSVIVCVFAAVFIFLSNTSFSQKNKEKVLDSALEATSEKWKVKEHQRIGGIGRPEFGLYSTLVAEKLDSPVLKKKRKDTLGTEVSFSSDEGWDISKFKIFEKKKFYRMVIGKETDTIEMQFYIHSVSHEKRQTFLGSLLSKDDKDNPDNNEKNVTLGYQKNIEGILLMAGDSVTARFSIEDYVSIRQTTNNDPEHRNPITSGYILIKNDSLFTEPVMGKFGDPKSNFFFEWQKGIFMNDAKGKHLALLQFGSDQPFYVRIAKDLDAVYKDAIASFFAVIIGVKDL